MSDWRYDANAAAYEEAADRLDEIEDWIEEAHADLYGARDLEGVTMAQDRLDDLLIEQDELMDDATQLAITLGID
jgi:phage shock protein A